MTAYPVNLDVAGRRCVVVGGGRVAQRKVEGLVACGAVVHVVAPVIGDEVKAQAASWDERPYAAGDLDGARLVVTTADDPAVNQQVFDDAEAAGIWVNSADDPERCTFTLPAVARQGPITVAVGTEGASPALAGWLRDRMAGDLGPEFATLAGLLAEARAAVRADGRSTEGLAWHSALDEDMLMLIRGGRISEARERLKTCLSSS